LGIPGYYRKLASKIKYFAQGTELMQGFKQWLEAISFGEPEDVRKHLEKYEPGTFGLEIEFWGAGKEIDYEQVELILTNDSDVYRDFEKSPYFGREEDDWENYITHLIKTGLWKHKWNPRERLPYKQDIESKIAEYRDFLTSLGEQASWGEEPSEEWWAVDQDESGVCEIKSRHLTVKDFPLLLKVLKKLQGEQFDHETGLHIHVGMPKTTNAFDLLAMTTLVDESAIKRAVGIKRRGQFRQYSALRHKPHSILGKFLEPGKVYRNKELLDYMKSALSRRTGTNILAFFEHGTVEFRYLSSEAVKNPERLLEWIEYYLMLPYIAKQETQIRLDNGLILTRLTRDKVRVDYEGEESPYIREDKKED